MIVPIIRKVFHILLPDFITSPPEPDIDQSIKEVKASIAVASMVSGSILGQHAIAIAAIAIVSMAIYGIARSAPAAQSGPTYDIPTGAVMAFDAAACPSGWSAYSQAEGRYLVGVPAGGTTAGTVGTALTNLENRPVGQHTHTINDPGHTHQVNDPGHSHNATDSGHSHAIDDPGHSHRMSGVLVDSSTFGDENASGYSSSTEGNERTNSSTTGVTIDTGYADVVTVNQTTGISIGSHETNFAVEQEGLVEGTNAPYIQYLMCRKD